MNQPRAKTPLGVRIAGTGMSVPDQIVTNDDLAKTVDTNDEWIVQRTGIRQRRLAGPDASLNQLAGTAMRRALDSAGLAADQMDLLLLATITPDMCCPSTAAKVVADIGAGHAGAMDLSAACSGFVYGLNIASSLIECGHYRTIGVIGAELLSRITNWDDRRTCVLFGDGAGAAVLTASDNPDQGCLYQDMGSDGGMWHVLYVPKTEHDLPVDHNGFNDKYHTLQMDGREVYKFAVNKLQVCIDQALASCNLKPTDLAMIVAHQSNSRILESARKKLGISEDRLYVNIDRFGNTSAASVPICLSELRDADRLHEGDLVLFVGLGGGLTWGASLWRL